MMDVGTPEPFKSVVVSDTVPMILGGPALAPQALKQLSATEQAIKRLMDVVFCLLIILVFSPLMVTLAMAVKFDSRGPILFRQERRGRELSTFGCLKFRTMVHDLADHTATQQTSLDDPRITRLGRFLRKYSLDELPQLFNVITGEMSLVGPRPHALGTSINGILLPDLHPHYLLRYGVRPGITGWAQINGWRGILDSPEKLSGRVEHDLYYIANWSLALDLQILIRTFTCLFGDERAY